MRNKIIFGILFLLILGLLIMILIDKQKGQAKDKYVFQVDGLNTTFYVSFNSSDIEKVNTIETETEKLIVMSICMI